MSVELHLPDLPEVPISLGTAVPAPGTALPQPRPWHQRVRDSASTYLPLLLMAALALATWWLVKHTPGLPPPPPAATLRHDPDYTMNRFAIERFDRGGQLRVRVEGDELRHYPDTDRFEVDRARIDAVGLDGRRTQALAVRALANGDISELQLLGDAHVTSAGASGPVLEMRSDFLHAFLVAEQVRTHRPVRMRAGADEMQAAGMFYDHGKRLLQLDGPLRVRLAAPAEARAGGREAGTPSAAAKD